MEPHIIIAILGGVVGLLGGICGVASLRYVKQQTQLLEKQVNALLHKDESYAHWSTEFDKAAQALRRLYRTVVNQTPTKSVHALRLVIPDRNLRERIELHLGRTNILRNRFHPHVLSMEQLLNPVVQNLITEVLRTVDQFKKEHTDWAREIGL
ncbi:hypothetical protein MYX77_04750 [Acidobacteriia bacterium AH_259_A11_L15]|nr:hypothetical protein [Acidobacteriia bacterium AH_259_A11_L15]